MEPILSRPAVLLPHPTSHSTIVISFLNTDKNTMSTQLAFHLNFYKGIKRESHSVLGQGGVWAQQAGLLSVDVLNDKAASLLKRSSGNRLRDCTFLIESICWIWVWGCAPVMPALSKQSKRIMRSKLAWATKRVLANPSIQQTLSHQIKWIKQQHQ